LRGKINNTFVRAIKKIIQEPLVHFIVIGATVFAFYNFIKGSYVDKDYAIQITKSDVEAMINKWMAQMKRPPAKQEVDIFLEDYVQREILFREAKAMGLDKNDMVVKNRMLQKLDFLTNDLLITGTPTDAEALKYFNDNMKKYTIPGKIDFIHIFFNLDKRSFDDAKQTAIDVKKSLNNFSSVPNNYFERGDLFILPYEFFNLSKDEVSNKFGQSELSEEIFGLEEKTWSGPYLSSYGLHLVYINNKKSSTTLQFEEVKSDIKDILIKNKRREAKNRIISELKKKYVITYTDELQTFADSLNLPLKEF
jgi:peptidyl-prolyl cis-trans isomerase C